eukprot:1342510-Amorphochlora_amoeboformis.AAC.3
MQHDIPSPSRLRSDSACVAFPRASSSCRGISRSPKCGDGSSRLSRRLVGVTFFHRPLETQ